MNYRELCDRLKAFGFIFAKEGSRHELWSKAGVIIAVPRKKVVNRLTAIRILKQAERV